jgi:hypothetical protein
MTMESRIAYERSAMIVLTLIFWIGTLTFFVPLFVSVLWTVALFVILAIQRSRTRRVHRG